MNRHEQYLNDRLPNPETLKKSVEEFENLNLSEISSEDLKTKLNEHFPILSFGCVKWDSKYHIYRVRRNLHNDFEPYNKIKDIGLPPEEDTPLGRANNQFKPIFYASHEPNLAIFESCQNLSSQNTFQTQNFTMGIWKVRENNILRLAPIIDNYDIQLIRKDVRGLSNFFDKLNSERIKSTKVLESSKIIRTFFANQFAKSNIKSVNDYKISAFFANTINEMNVYSTEKFDGIIYPSVANRYRGENVAIFPSSLHKLDPVKCLSVTSYNFNFNNGTLVTGILEEGQILGDGQIKWKNRI